MILCLQVVVRCERGLCSYSIESNLFLKGAGHFGLLCYEGKGNQTNGNESDGSDVRRW